MTENRLIIKIFREGDTEPIFHDIFPNIETAKQETNNFRRNLIYEEWKKVMKNGKKV